MQINISTLTGRQKHLLEPEGHAHLGQFQIEPLFHGDLYVDSLREEARIAAMATDSVAAVDAYQHYFALRDFRPNYPPWAAQWDPSRDKCSLVCDSGRYTPPYLTPNQR